MTLRDDKIVWRDRSNAAKEFSKADLESMGWTMFGSKGHLRLAMKDGSTNRLDGFVKSDFEHIASFARAHYDMELTREQVQCFSTKHTQTNSKQ